MSSVIFLGWMLFSWICNVRHSFVSFWHLIFYFVHNFCRVISHDESFGICLFLVNLHCQVVLIHHESYLRTLRIAHYRRGEQLHYEDKFVAPHSPKFYQVSPVDLVPLPHFPLLRRPGTVTIQFWIICWREFNRLPWSIICNNRSPMILISVTSIPWAWSSWRRHDRWHPRTEFRRRFWFAVTRSSPESCWDRLAIVSEQTVELKWLMSNKLNKWFHSARVKFHLIKISASSFLVTMYLIWILESRLIRSFCGFLKPVSLFGFFPLWSSWSLRYLQKCATALHFEMKLCLPLSRFNNGSTFWYSCPCIRSWFQKLPGSRIVDG